MSGRSRVLGVSRSGVRVALILVGTLFTSPMLVVAGPPRDRDLISDGGPTTIPAPANTMVNIPEGYRVVTIGVDPRSGFEGWARPGLVVDVMWVRSIGDQRVVTVLGNGRILSHHRDTNAKSKADKGALISVRVVVTGKDAEKIEVSSKTGELSLSFRACIDPCSPIPAL